MGGGFGDKERKASRGKDWDTERRRSLLCRFFVFVCLFFSKETRNKPSTTVICHKAKAFLSAREI